MTPSEEQILEAIEAEPGLTAKQLYNTIQPAYSWNKFCDALKKLSYNDKLVNRIFKKFYRSIRATYSIKQIKNYE